MEFNYGREPMYKKFETDGPVNDTSDLGPRDDQDIEEPIAYPGEIGQSVTEGSRFGNFLQTVTGAIRTGASKIELQTQMGGGAEAVGAEAYGKEARQALTELAKANEVELTSVHVPTQVGNVSGFNPQQGFVDEQRKQAIDEIKKAVDFAADVTKGGSIVFHTGEYQRPISEQEWAVRRDANGNPMRDSDGNLLYDFLAYKEEPGKAITYMVDDRTGKIIGDVRKSNVIREPEYKRADHSYDGYDLDGKKAEIKEGDLITDDGRLIDMRNPDHLFHRVATWDQKYRRFKTTKLTWDEIEKRRNVWNEKYPNDPITSEEMAYRIQVETQIMQYRGSSLFHGRFYEDERRERDEIAKALKFWKDLERKVPEEEVWKLWRSDPKSRRFGELVGFENKTPSQILEKGLEDLNASLQFIHEASASADAQADTLKDTLEHVAPISEYAENQSFNSLAEAGIHAMHKTKEKNLKKDIYLSPENIFPEMGYGSHPDEIIDLVYKSRDRMVDFLTKKKIMDPHNRLHLVYYDNGREVSEDEAKKLEAEGRRIEAKEKIMMVENPFYRKGMSEAEAKKYAERHIKANLDTQHLGMWAKHFQPRYLQDKGRIETPEETNKRFDAWYKEQVEKLSKSGVLGEIHIVDGFHTGGHSHLPAGQGDLPVVDAVKYLKEHGFKGVMISEGHGEEAMGAGRILTKAWEAFGTSIFNRGYFNGAEGIGAPIRFTDVHQSYFQKKQGPYFVFGAYSPSNDWTLWSEVPLE